MLKKSEKSPLSKKKKKKKKFKSFKSLQLLIKEIESPKEVQTPDVMKLRPVNNESKYQKNGIVIRKEKENESQKESKRLKEKISKRS